jgi:hypothetical protein
MESIRFVTAIICLNRQILGRMIITMIMMMMINETELTDLEVTL